MPNLGQDSISIDPFLQEIWPKDLTDGVIIQAKIHPASVKKLMGHFNDLNLKMLSSVDHTD